MNSSLSQAAPILRSLPFTSQVARQHQQRTISRTGGVASGGAVARERPTQTGGREVRDTVAAAAQMRSGQPRGACGATHPVRLQRVRATARPPAFLDLFVCCSSRSALRHSRLRPSCRRQRWCCRRWQSGGKLAATTAGATAAGHPALVCAPQGDLHLTGLFVWCPQCCVVFGGCCFHPNRVPSAHG